MPRAVRLFLLLLPLTLVLLIFVDTIYFMYRRFDRLFVPDDLHWYLLFISFLPLVYFELRPSIGRKIYLIAVGCLLFVVMSAMVAALYLGGWHIPFLDIEKLGFSLPTALVAMVHLTVFMVKTLLVVFVVMWLRWTLPRLRVDQLMGMCWKGMLPIAFINVLGTAVWMWVFKGQSMMQLLAGHG